MLSCDVICDLMAVHESGEASAETQRLIEEHLARCPSCRSAFGKGARVERTLSATARDEEPANAHGFVSRTRRLFFFLGAGVLLYFACQMAVFLRLAATELAGVSLRSFPGSTNIWLAVAAAAFALYGIFALVLTTRTGGTRGEDAVKAIIGGLLMSILALSAFHLVVAGSIIAGVAAFLLVIAALVVTFAQLPRLPYFTIATVIALLVANGILVAQAIDGFANMGALRSARALELGAPGDSVTADAAARVDLRSLGLTFVEVKPVRDVAGVAVGAGASAATALYRKGESEATLTCVELAGTDAADDLFRAWKSSILPRVRLMSHENNMPGPDGGPSHYLSLYGPLSKRAYVAWQSGEWITIITVQGSMKESRALAGEMKRLVSVSYGNRESR